MDGPHTPGRGAPPDYSLPGYDDDLSALSGNGAAVRLLTSVDDPILDNRHTRSRGRSYQPSVSSSHSRRSSILNPPNMAPPDTRSYVSGSYISYGSGASPTRPWTPSHVSSAYAPDDYRRPADRAPQYEPADLNGSPRPGTPSSLYGGSPRRPLPPAPLFSNGMRSSAFVDDATVSIPLSDVDDVFGPGESDVSDARTQYYQDHRGSYAGHSQVTLNDGDSLDDEHVREGFSTVSGSGMGGDGMRGGGHDGQFSEKHYGPAPEGKQERRGVRDVQTSRKEVQLINGELVLECKIPTILYSFLPRRDEIEFTHMRYTAVTCDPDDFVERGYKLRQSIGRTTRETELFVCITMYNENEYDFTRTMHAVMKNITHFCKRSKSRTWGENGWQKIVVCVVSDGREKIHPRTLDALAAMGVYQHGIAKNYVNQKTCLSPDTMVRTTNGDKAIRDIVVGDQLFDHEDRPVQCLAAKAIQTSRMMKITYTGYNSVSKSSFTCTPDHIMTLVAYGVKPFKHSSTASRPSNGKRVTWWTRCDRTELEVDAVEIKWDAAMHDLYTEYREQLGRLPTDGEVREYLKAITSTKVIPDSEDDVSDDPQRVTKTNQSPVLIKLLAKLKAMDVSVDDEDESVVLMLLQQHMEDYLEHMIPEPEDIPEEEDDDLIIDLDANRKRKIVTISTLSSRTSAKTFRQSPSIRSFPVRARQEPQNEASQSTVSTYASVLSEDDHREMFASVRAKLAVRDPRSKCQNLSCKGLRRVSALFETPEQADLALQLLSGDHYRVVDPCAVRDMEVFTMTLEEYQATCTAPMTQHMSKLRLYRSPLRFQPYQGPVSPVPIDPFWFGFWLGDGTKNSAEITSTDPEVEVYTQALVDRLNRDSKPPGKAPLKVSKYKIDIGTKHVYKGEEVKSTKVAHRLRVMSTANNLGKTHWNPVHDGLKELGLLGDKSGGIPDCYMNADENTRLAVLAGLIESDGWLSHGLNCYGFVQYTYEHKKLVEDARKLALSCGIQCNPIIERANSKDRPEPGWFFYMGRGVEKFQPHLILHRKRMKIPFNTFKNRDVRPFDVEDAGDGEFRLIEVSGELFQLADRTVVHNCTAHVYEYTTQVSLDSDLKFKGAEKGIVPCQMIFCLKERNQRKLNSHRWFFNAFGKALNPNVCILLDVGTRPGSNSLYHLWKAFDTDSNVAGACGEITAMKGKWGVNLLNPLVASQNFEYKMSNILDKPLESVFGYITVLPGALSAYRYHALQNDSTGHGPLSQYFKGETLHGQHADVFTANMYLAEDRILCWELVAKRDERWVLKYVKGCTGETDVPDTVPEFISQRRRWLNGAFFAAIYSLVHFRQIWATDHTIARKVLLHIEFIYQLLNVLFTYFSLANFYLTFYFVAGGLADDRIDPFGNHIGLYIFTILRYTLVLLICSQFILSLGNRPQGAKRPYMASLIILSIVMVYTTFATFYIVVKQLTDPDNKDDLRMGNNVFTNLIVSMASTIGLYFLMSFMYLDPWHMFTSTAQYFLLLPFYLCTLQVYAFCNTHDVTWGTKGDNVIKTDLGGAVGKGSTVELEMPSEQLDIDSGYDEALRNLRDRIEVPPSPPSEAQMQEDYYKSVRTYMVVSWMIANGILAMAVSETYSAKAIGDNYYLRFILWSVAALALFRALGSTTFAIINVVNMAVEGRVRLSLKLPPWLGGSRGSGSRIGASSVLGGGSAVSSGISTGKTWISDKWKKLRR
ncbi:hypothetical protein GGTG_03012 [Gaeumannomyces tritici R3-111a-1]|uniref:chitin synthase n=1 Tax=Gaeumannomyces tritici (strain R3-111a-1) TaxID=644352 RepID=J3NP06_GAET3|nr:hypothetical protein GGTG_03012 [Gaeumannomyces tritici R3-111a-1]EJT77909.1 hypothetical protein GGTG_03012 [Gaeumannomyces tritici R3-111a-1]